MDRKNFISLATAAFLGYNHRLWGASGSKPDVLYFTDDGIIPNSKYPLIRYRNAFSMRGTNGAEWLEKKFLENDWSNSWRNGIFTFQHYHSIAHEVLGIFNGEARVLLGGEQGEEVTVAAGDIIVIPAGVGHKNLESHDLRVVGAYPKGMPVDIMRGLPGERPTVDRNISAVPFPDRDPLLGDDYGLRRLWN